MESLLASYASSDEEEEQQNQDSTPELPPVPGPGPSSHSAASLFSSLPRPNQATKLPFSSIPEPQNPRPSEPPSGSEGLNSQLPNPRLKLFSYLPQPKQSQNPAQQPKKVVQIRPQISLSFPKGVDVDDEEEEDEGEKEKKRKRDLESAAQNSSVRSFLSNLPVARSSATLGAMPSSGSGRRSIIDTDSTGPSPSLGGNSQPRLEQNGEGYDNYINHDSSVVLQIDTSGSGDTGGNNDVQAGVDQYDGGYYGSYVDPSSGSYLGYDNSYENYYPAEIDQSVSMAEPSSYGGYGGYSNNGNASVGSVIKVTGKRGRNEIPAEIVEVKQDELMKNRPREDQMKSTGIAFGPAYQPVSTKGKPTKLHKRKHQIGSLYFDMKQKEMELTERRAKGYQTKAQTQGKYGW